MFTECTVLFSSAQAHFARPYPKKILDSAFKYIELLRCRKHRGPVHFVQWCTNSYKYINKIYTIVQLGPSPKTKEKDWLN
jgi:hypothetical protein